MLPSTIVAGSHLPTRVRNELDWPLPIARGARQMRAKRVQEWLTIAGFSLNIDSDFGAATEQRVKDFQSNRGLPATGQVDARTHEQLVDPLVKAIAPINAGNRTLADLILSYAVQHVAQHPVEAGGDNCGPWVRAYMGQDGPDWRWCSGFVCFALEQAARTLGVRQPIPSSASCDTMSANARNAGLYHREGTVRPSQILPGSFFLVRRTNNDWTHIGVVSDAGADTMRTVEGNTDSGGSDNGFEASERVRNYAKKDFIIW
ncbi:peptidoglycan-binding domain-containing protein [Arvimicrobium flavum]|uniref:peptidoglycan-binding domain-containing protein n=1 Tax=Arvimicrobium flavum TaxID=3393320 RepID=UPI00237B30A0|nr:peptidoglycan-binding protein [Mesorhizobium shangrilense]